MQNHSLEAWAYKLQMAGCFTKLKFQHQLIHLYCTHVKSIITH